MGINYIFIFKLTISYYRWPYNHMVVLPQALTTKLLGRGTNLKKKTVTIIHSATTETVRLPDDNNGVS